MFDETNPADMTADVAQELNGMTFPEGRWCFVIIETQRNEHGYVPSVVVEGEAGHSPLIGSGEHAEPWYWGTDLGAAKAICAQENAKLGLTERDASEIVLSSMAASLRRGAAEERMRQLGLR